MIILLINDAFFINNLSDVDILKYTNHFSSHKNYYSKRKVKVKNTRNKKNLYTKNT